jgi:hypothetical protein
VALIAATLLVCLTAGTAAAWSLQRRVPDKASVPDRQTAAPTGRIIIKFSEDSGLVMRETGLAGGDMASRQRVQSLVADKASVETLKRHFSQSFEELDALRRTGQARVKSKLPDLNAYAVLDLSGRATDRQGLLEVLKGILADPAVETAFLEPRPVPAALGFDAFTGEYTAPENPAAEPALTDSRSTPDFSANQGYLLAPPGGINALAVNEVPGARGQNMKLVDVELGWNFDHEDLPPPFFTEGNINSTLDNRNHGTAVLGEVRGHDNGFGVRGITPDAQVGASSAYFSSVATAIMRAWQAVDPGDVLLIELHAPGPAADGTGQFGYVPMEYWQDNFDTIMVVTANGAVVVEAAGNGSQNLDDPIYGSLFDRDYRDSGAIMCGAATASGTPYSWSNNGTRVDLNGWGGNVYTCGYGDLQGSPEVDEDQYYTAYFSGTSSASPIVTGAVMALQGMSKANYGITLDAVTIRTLMNQTGTPQNAGPLVGPRPDIQAAYQNLEWGLGEISGTVTDAETGLPIGGVQVTLTADGTTVQTDPEGRYQLIAPVGSQDLSFAQYFYFETFGSREVSFDEPAVLDVAMTRLPAVDVKAIVRTTGGVPVDCRATALDAPLTVETLGADHEFLFAGVPVGLPISLRFDGAPDHGVDVVTLTPAPSASGYNFLYPQLTAADHTFELWWEGYTASGGHWVWGTPTAGPVAFGGEKCWGVGMEGDYPDGTGDLLTSQSYNLNGHEQVLLSLHYWSDLEDGRDGVNLQMLSYNNTWVDIEPVGGYSHQRVSALGNKPGWSGDSGGWQGAVFDITAFTDLMVSFRFKFYSDSSVRGAGFFIDDVTFDTGDSVTPVQWQDDLPGRPMTVTAHPNPFNPTTSIAWSAARPGRIGIKVYDLAGRLVRVLLDEHRSDPAGSVVWDGTDDRGRSLSSGTYLVRVKDGSGQTDTRRVALIK